MRIPDKAKAVLIRWVVLHGTARVLINCHSDPNFTLPDLQELYDSELVKFIFVGSHAHFREQNITHLAQITDKGLAHLDID